MFHGLCVYVCCHHILGLTQSTLSTPTSPARPARAMLCRQSDPCAVLGPGGTGLTSSIPHCCCFCGCRAGIAAPQGVGKHSLGCLALGGSVLAQPACCCDSGKQEGLGGEGMSCKVSGLCEPSPSWIVYEISLCSLRFPF